jgi:hypothetical protein
MLCLAAVAAACGGENFEEETADVAGSYTLSVTSRENGCNFPMWMEGTSTTGIPLVVTQDGTAVTAMLDGLAGVTADIALGSRTFTGTITGSRMSLQLYGTRSHSSGNCTFTYNAAVSAVASGDSISGSLAYSPKTNGNPDCSSIDGCVSRQEFAGSRPPK